MKISKGCLVKLSYKTYADGKVIDSSELHKPLEIVYGFTKISSELEKKLKDKEVGAELEFKQNVNSNAMQLDFDVNTFDDETQEVLKKNREIELNIKGKWLAFKVVSLDPQSNSVKLEYHDPMAGKKLLHKLKVIEVKKVVAKGDKDGKNKKTKSKNHEKKSK